MVFTCAHAMGVRTKLLDGYMKEGQEEIRPHSQECHIVTMKTLCTQSLLEITLTGESIVKGVAHNCKPKHSKGVPYSFAYTRYKTCLCKSKLHSTKQNTA